MRGEVCGPGGAGGARARAWGSGGRKRRARGGPNRRARGAEHARAPPAHGGRTQNMLYMLVTT